MRYHTESHDISHGISHGISRGIPAGEEGVSGVRLAGTSDRQVVAASTRNRVLRWACISLCRVSCGIPCRSIDLSSYRGPALNEELLREEAISLTYNRKRQAYTYIIYLYIIDIFVIHHLNVPFPPIYDQNGTKTLLRITRDRP